MSEPSASPPRYRLGRKAASIVAILALAPLAWVSGNRGIGGAAGEMMQQHLQYRMEKKQTGGEAAWERTDWLFQLARQRTGGDPQLLQQGGQLLIWKAELEGENLDQAEKSLDQAIALYRDSVRIRPAWPYAWLGFAFAKARRNALDQEFQHAFATTLQLGPREETIQIEAARLGFGVWPALTYENQERLVQNVRNAMVSQPEKIITLIRKERKETQVCAHLLDGPQFDALCGKLDLR